MPNVIVKFALPIVAVLASAAYLYVTFSTPITPFQTSTTASVNQATFAITPIEDAQIDDRGKAKLGYELFLDPQLSSNKQVSCESCHHLFQNGAEEIAISKGVNGEGTRNSPTVFNVGLNTRFFWDGRAASLAQQIDGPIHPPKEMDSNWPTIVEGLSGSDYYQKRFTAEYNGMITETTIKDALVRFMETLNTPDAPFDRYLKGEENALSPVAINGWHKFQQLGCVYCHQGQNIGGNIFQKFGNLYQIDTNASHNQDLGRYEQTGVESDKYVFRVPSLRNVAITAPYFHDGRATTLEEAIAVMAQMQLGKELSPTTIVEINAFLESLTAPKPKALQELML